MSNSDTDPAKISEMRRKAAVSGRTSRLFAVVVGLVLILTGIILRVSTLNWQLFLARVLAWKPPLPAYLVVAGLLLVVTLWKLPKWQIARSRGLTPENQFDRENEARKTLAQILGGVFLLAGLYSSLETLSTAREGQITDRFTKAIEQLGAVDDSGKLKLELRLGAIYALERIARDSERDHWPVMEVLTAYVRENSEGKRREDIQAILAVLGRRQLKHERPKQVLHLNRADLRGVNLREANLSRVNLSWANLEGVDLSWANLSGTILIGANLIRAVLDQADLREANLTRALLFKAVLPMADLRGARLGRTILEGADLRRADLRGAFLIGAILQAADLSEASLIMARLSAANLRKANLSGASLTGAMLPVADLSEANLTRAYLLAADLRGARNLTQDQINGARGDKNTILPEGLQRPPEWLNQ